MNQIKNTTALNLILLFSIFALLAAYFSQYILCYQPCNLCLIERVPYILSIVIITLNFAIRGYKRIFIFSLILVFVSATLISLYHVGIEQGYVQESLICGLKSASNILTKEDIIKQLNEQTISCKNVTLTIAGLSLATLNIIASFFLSAICIKIFFNYEKNKQKKN